MFVNLFSLAEACWTRDLTNGKWSQYLQALAQNLQTTLEGYYLFILYVHLIVLEAQRKFSCGFWTTYLFTITYYLNVTIDSYRVT